MDSTDSIENHIFRFSDVRNTFQGKLEEGMPFFSLLFPPWFIKSFPNAIHNLAGNKDRLTTSLDVHATIKHLISLGEDDSDNNANKKENGVHPKGHHNFDTGQPQFIDMDQPKFLEANEAPWLVN